MVKYLFRTYVWPYKYRFAAGLLLLVLNSYLTAILPVYIMNIVDSGIQAGDKTMLVSTIVKYVAIFAGYIVSMYVMTVELERLGQDILIRLKSDSFEKVLSWDYRMFTDLSPGKLVTRVEGDPEKVRFFFVTAAVTVLQSVLMLIFMLVIMFRTNSSLAMYVLYPLPPLILLIILLQRFIFPMFKKVRKYMADITSKITEYMSGLDIIKSFAREQYFFGIFDDVNRKKYKLERNAEFGWITFFNVLFMMQEIIIALIFKASASMMAKAMLTYGVLIMFIEYVRMFFFPLIGISEQISQIQRALAAFSRVYAMHTEEITIKNGSKEIESMEKQIEFRDVNFSYVEGERVLKDLDFIIPAGEKWALVGETGGGKSTIIKLLLRFYDTDSGKIIIDGNDIREIDIRSLRKNIALIEQEFYLFPATVLDNIRLFDQKISPDKVKRICRDAGIEGFIESLPDGYMTDLYEEGGNLSVGERQLLSIARAMVKSSDLILMDEATSSIDPMTEKMIERAISELMKGKTSIVVAHRLATVMDSDRILVISGGRIVESGSHDELYEKGGKYFELCEQQLNMTPENGELV